MYKLKSRDYDVYRCPYIFGTHLNEDGKHSFYKLYNRVTALTPECIQQYVEELNEQDDTHKYVFVLRGTNIYHTGALIPTTGFYIYKTVDFADQTDDTDEIIFKCLYTDFNTCNKYCEELNELDKWEHSFYAELLP